MRHEERELWQELCEQAAKEQDPQKLSESVAQINRLLEDKQDRLNKTRKSSVDSGSSRTPTES
jgi:argonaute-like protein implicated in RNA metabolism and viral defense